jgi:hypothetical protein
MIMGNAWRELGSTSGTGCQENSFQAHNHYVAVPISRVFDFLSLFDNFIVPSMRITPIQGSVSRTRWMYLVWG